MTDMSLHINTHSSVVVDTQSNAPSCRHLIGPDRLLLALCELAEKRLRVKDLN